MTIHGAFPYGAGPLARCGYSPVPLRAGQKRPLMDKWDHLRTRAMTFPEIAQLSRTQPMLGLGVAGGFGGLVPIDIDTEDPIIMAAVAKVLPKPVVAKAGRRGLTVFYRMRGEIPARKFKKANGDMMVEVLTTGQTVIPPTIHPDTKEPYRWLSKNTLFNTAIGELPEITAGHVAALENALKPWLPVQRVYEAPKVDPNAAPTSDKRQRSYALKVMDGEVRTLSAMGKDSGRNWQLFRSAAKLGKYVHHNIVAAGEVEAALMGACRANGLLQEDGPKQCRDTLLSGIHKARNDKLNPLPSKPYKSKQVAA